MALPIYLAMTASEYARCPSLPENPGWMACHFSSYGTGLSNIPDQFPAGGILMVNDRIPPACHSSQLIVQQLLQAVEKLSPRAIVLDFDNTLVPYTTDVPTAEVKNWLVGLKQAGFAVCIVSNSHNSRVCQRSI